MPRAGGQRLQTLKVALLTHANAATLMQAANDLTAGRAVTAPNSGTVAFAADWVGNKTLVDQQFMSDGTTYSIALFYAD